MFQQDLVQIYYLHDEQRRKIFQQQPLRRLLKFVSHRNYKKLHVDAIFFL